MGERKGTNMYYPPDYDPRKGGLNKSQGTHALRERARKLHMGILIIRFEMPYNIWCDACGLHVGMGVRYNAEKKKIGMYYTTPVYQFKMKCTQCPNYYEIKTDPANLDYIIVSGAKRQEKRWDPTTNGQVVPDEKSTINKLYTDSMFKLEHGVIDKTKATQETGPRIKNLTKVQNKMLDDYEANRLLRDSMRAKRKIDKLQKEIDDQIRIKNSINISLIPETEEDKKMASLLGFSKVKSIEKREDIMNESIFNPSSSSSNIIHSIIQKHKTKKALCMKKISLGVLIKKKTPVKSPGLVPDYGSSSSENE